MTHIAVPCSSCGCDVVPGPQPCNATCTDCQRGTRPRRIKLTVSGVVERAGYTPFGGWPVVGPSAGGEEDSPFCSIRGDEITDPYGCAALNREYFFGCSTDGTGCGASNCQWSATATINKGQCDPPLALYTTMAVQAFFFDGFSGGYSRPLVSIGWNGMPGAGPGESCASSLPVGETGAGAIFTGTAPPGTSAYDCSAQQGVLSQYLVESSWCPCDFSNAVVTLEILEYAYVLPDTLFLSIVGSDCLDDDVVDPVQIDYDAANNRYVGSIHCGDQTKTVWFYCSSPPTSSNQCRSPNDSTTQGNWTLQIFGGSCNVNTSARSTSQDPFYWESTGSQSVTGCCDCESGDGSGITFIVTE